MRRVLGPETMCRQEIIDTLSKYVRLKKEQSVLQRYIARCVGQQHIEHENGVRIVSYRWGGVKYFWEIQFIGDKEIQ